MEKRTVIVGLMADPGTPMSIAAAIVSDLAKQTSQAQGGDWQIELDERRLPLDSSGEVPLFAEAGRLRATAGWDYLVYLTDLPRIHDGMIELCQVSGAQQAAIVSIPALGIRQTKRSVRNLVAVLVASAEESTREHPSRDGLSNVLGRLHLKAVAGEAQDDTARVYLPGVRNRLALLGGMIRSNRPGRLLATLTNSFAIAFATGAFGIFYGSIWDLSDALPGWRLLFISVAAVVVLGAWLVVRNGLWARGRDPAAPWQAGLDNAATVFTIGLSVLAFHTMLIASLVALAAVVIERDYLAEQLDHAVSATDYLQLSSLSASMGTLAGAVGTNFNSEESIREATYSRRVYERRKLAESFVSEDED